MTNSLLIRIARLKIAMEADMLSIQRRLTALQTTPTPIVVHPFGGAR
jgi:hypothetical protein